VGQAVQDAARGQYPLRRQPVHAFAHAGAHRDVQGVGQHGRFMREVAQRFVPQEGVARHGRRAAVVLAIDEDRMAQDGADVHQARVCVEQRGAAGDAEPALDADRIEQGHEVGPDRAAEGAGLARRAQHLVARAALRHLALRLAHRILPLHEAGRDPDHHHACGAVHRFERDVVAAVASGMCQ